jgi:hypothetical protein
MACDISRKRAEQVGQPRGSAGSLIVQRPNPTQRRLQALSGHSAKRWMIKCLCIDCSLAIFSIQLQRQSGSPQGFTADYGDATEASDLLMHNLPKAFRTISKGCPALKRSGIDSRLVKSAPPHPMPWDTAEPPYHDR